jgi:uncharacterized repeat protein (TIGR01451 family)
MRYRNVGQSVAGVILIGMLLLAPLAQAQGPTPPPPHRGLRYEIDQQGMLPLLPGARPQALTGDRANVSECAPWSRLVFASYRNEHDWDVYSADGDGNNPVRLTTYSKTDTAPKYNQGCTRIAYQSYQETQYDIYVMDANGAGRTNLTNHSADDGLPCWSPDNARIAFQSDRAGNGEVYVMNANGSNPINLTNHPAYDGMPAWSPDGTQIAFVSNRTGLYEIWVMNADGTGQTQVTHGVPWAEYPCWSPDGTKIVFSNDDNGDGFMDVDVVNMDGTGFAFLAGHESKVDCWYPAWSPDGEWIAYSRTELIYYQGQWYWTRSDIYIRGAPQYSYPPTTFVYSGYDWRLHWGTLDTQPPVSRMDSLPMYSRVWDLEVNWSGIDIGPAGIKHYDVQYKDGASGSWTDWLTRTTNTSARFEGETGHTYYFRCQAQDEALHVEKPHGGRGDTYTTLYTYKLTGVIRDNRDTPISHATLDILPDPVSLVNTAITSGYEAYLSAVGVHTLTATCAGYGSRPLTVVDIQRDSWRHLCLPPHDDIIMNGGFETLKSAPMSWVVGGTIAPTVTSAIKYSGDHSVFLGQISTVDELVGEQVWGATSIAIDSEDTIHVVWSGGGPDTNLYYSRKVKSGLWSSPLNIGTGWLPSLAVDASGTLHVVWTGGSASILYRNRTAEGIWSAPVVIYTHPQESQSDPAIAADSEGNLHVVWHNGYSVYYSQRPQGGSWTTREAIPRIGWYAGAPHIAVDRQGTVHVVWYSSDTSGAQYTSKIRGGSWSSATRLIDPSSPFFHTYGTSIAVDEQGTVHAIQCGERLYNTYEALYAVKKTSEKWHLPPALDKTQWPFSIGGVELAYSARSGLYAIWTQYESSSPSDKSILRIADKAGDAGWSLPTTIAVDASDPRESSIAVDSAGNPYILYKSQGELRCWGPGIGRQAESSQIAQQVDLSSDIFAPTLSFMYKVDKAFADPSSWLEVTVANTSTNTTVFSTISGRTDWTHGWVDLSPWKGQVITLTFGVSQLAGAPRTGVYIDEVSLGSAYPNLWVQKTSSTVPPGGSPVRYTITYGNLGGVPAQGVRLTDTLPISVTFVSASVPPTSTAPLVWDVGNQAAGAGPYTIIVTATVDAGVPTWTTLANTVTIGAATPEADRDNNTAVAQTFVGYRLYLPLAARDG